MPPPQPCLQLEQQPPTVTNSFVLDKSRPLFALVLAAIDRRQVRDMLISESGFPQLQARRITPHGRGKGGARARQSLMKDRRRLRIEALVALIKRQRNNAGLVTSDAAALIQQFGEQAYYEARRRVQSGGSAPSDRPRGHWTRVKLEIAKRQGIEVGLTGWDRTE
jgi:hypothetical protein